MTPTLAAVALVGLWCLLWAPFFWCCCTPPDCTTTVNVTVTGCVSYESGVAVAVKVGGSTLASGTTNGSGYVSLSPSAPSGTAATVEFSKTGYNATSSSITLTCGTVTVSKALTVATGYSCNEDPCCPQGGSPPYLLVTYPSTLTLTDAFGDVTLTGGPSGPWTGSATRTASYAVNCATCAAPVATQDVTVYFSVVKSLAPGYCWTLTVTVYACGHNEGVSDGLCPTLYVSGGPQWDIYPGTAATAVSGTNAYTYGAQNRGQTACPPSLTIPFTVSFLTAAIGVPTIHTTPWFVYGDSNSFAVAE